MYRAYLGVGADATALVWLIRLAPLLWLGGLLYTFLACLLLITALRRWPKDLLTSLLCWLWISVGVAQAMASVLNGIVIGDLAFGLRNALSFTVLGWIIAGSALAAGAGYKQSGKQLASLLAWMAVYTLLLGLPALLLSWAGVAEKGIPTPISLLAGDSDVVRFYASALFYLRESTFGEVTTRLCLMYPWPPALGIGSVGLGLICSRVNSPHWRWAGYAGSALGLVFSWGRLAIVSSIIVAVLLWGLRLTAWQRTVAVAGSLSLVLLLYMTGFNPADAILGAQAAVGEARSGSSMARTLIYEASWAGFLESPWIGHGWVGESVHPVEPLPIGSHSTVFGLLYTGGIPVFGAFVAAMTTTLLAIVAAAVRTRDPERRKDLAVAACLWTVLCLAASYESLYSLALPCFFYFMWIGAAVYPDDKSRLHESRAAGPRAPSLP